MRIWSGEAKCCKAYQKGGPPLCPASKPCWSPDRRSMSRWSPFRSKAWNDGDGNQSIQAGDRLHDLYRLDAGEGLASADIGGIQPEIFLRQRRRDRFEGR